MPKKSKDHQDHIVTIETNPRNHTIRDAWISKYESVLGSGYPFLYNFQCFEQNIWPRLIVRVC